MGPIHLFQIASERNAWLVARQTAIAENIANANTPGFKAIDVKPFDRAVERTRLAMTTTMPGHLSPAAGEFPTTKQRQDGMWEIAHSGNNVSIEREMMKAGEVAGSYSLNVSIIRAFHRMFLASTRG